MMIILTMIICIITMNMNMNAIVVRMVEVCDTTLVRVRSLVSRRQPHMPGIELWQLYPLKLFVPSDILPIK